MFGVVLEQYQGNGVQGGFDCTHLREHVDAVAVLVHHLLDAADLAFDSSETGLHLRLVRLVAWHAFKIPLGGTGLFHRALPAPRSLNWMNDAAIAPIPIISRPRGRTAN
jgi:hypothetical protein